MAQQNVGSAFEESDYEYENEDTIPTEFIKVEHIYDIMSDEFSEPEDPHDVTCEDPFQPDSPGKDPLAPDPEADPPTSVEPPELLEVKTEAPDDTEQVAEETQLQENKGDAAAMQAASPPAQAIDDDDSSESSARITRSQSKQSGEPQYTEVKETEPLAELIERRVFECDLCEMTFGWRSSLYRHKKRRHKSKPKGKQLSKAAAKTNPVVSVQKTTKEATDKTCADKKIAQSCVPQAEKTDITIPQQTSPVSDGNSHGSKQLIIDHLRRHISSYQCNLCGRKFSSRWHLDRHVNSHPVMKPFRCPLCFKSFVWERNLKVHLRVYHIKDSDHQSVGKTIHESAQITPKPNSNSGTNAADIKSAVSESSFVSEQEIFNESLQCSVCSKRFTKLLYLKMHMRKHLSIKPLSCLVCGSRFSSKSGLRKHSMWHCKDTNLKEKKKPNVSSEKNDGNKEKISETSDERDLATENVPEKSMTPEVQDEIAEDKTRKSHQQVETKDNLVETNSSAASCSSQVTQEQYQCIICPKQTNSKAAMLAHMQLHMGGDQTRCSICGKDVLNLPRHMLQHTGEKPFQCTVCEKKFTRKEHFVKHELSCPQKTVHDIKRRDAHQQRDTQEQSDTQSHTQQHDVKRKKKVILKQCPICKKMFNVWYLKQHLRIHSGTKPLECKFCPRTFRFQSPYLNHLRSHKKIKQDSLEEKITKEETIRNASNKEIVNYNATEQQALGTYECSICGKYLDSKAALLCHEFRHEGKKSSVCKICDKKLSSSKVLLSHMRIHTGEKPFECGVCKKKFAWRESFQKHSKTHIQRNNLAFDKGQSEHPQINGGSVGDKTSEDLRLTENIPSGNLKETKKANSFHSKMITVSKVAKKSQKTNTKKFRCKICDKIFSTKINFFVHLQSHSREETFVCPVCHNIFSKRETLKIHMKSHAQISNQKSIKESSCINSEKRKGNVQTEIEAELLTFPPKLISRKPSQTSSISTKECQIDNSFLVNHLKDYAEVSSSDSLEMRKLPGKNVLHNIDSKIHSRDVAVADSNQRALQGSIASQGQDSRTKRRSSQSQEIEPSSGSRSRSYEERGEMQSEVKSYEGNGSKRANNTPLACELCGKVFSQQPKLLRHLMNQGCVGQFECNVCHKKYSSKERLDGHMLLHSKDSSKQDSGEEARSQLQSSQEPEVIVIHSRSPSPEQISENLSTDTRGFDKCGDFHSMIVNNVKEKHHNENMVKNLTLPDKTTFEKLAEFSRSSLPRRQLLPSARTDMAQETNIMNAHVGRQMDIYSATKAHTITTPLTQSILQRRQLALQSHFQMSDSWKETAMGPHPDHRGHGNSIQNVNPLMFAQSPGAWYGIPSTNYTPTHDGFYGWVPQTPTYQEISSSNSVYMTKMPPPYPENNMYKNYPPPAYNETHFMQYVSSQRGETLNIHTNNKEDRRPNMP